MTEGDKKLLLKDLSARLPYNVKVLCSYYDDTDDTEPTVKTFTLTEINTENGNYPYWIGGEQLQDSGFSNGTTSFAVNIDDELQYIKPYLRPITSITENEEREIRNFFRKCIDDLHGKSNEEQFFLGFCQDAESLDYLNMHHLDYRGLIGMGLAIEAPEGMYEI